MAVDIPPATMEEISIGLAKLWRSERLVYEGFTDTDESRKAFHTIMSDPVTYGLSMTNILKAMTPDANNKIHDKLAKEAILGMFIRLPPPDGEKGPNQTIGFIHIMERFDGGGQIGLCLVAEHQNRGYGREAINWILDWAFRYGRLHRVAISTAGFNERALHLYQDMGFVCEGRSRKAFWMDLKWHDMVNYAMLEEEWKALRGIA